MCTSMPLIKATCNDVKSRQGYNGAFKTCTRWTIISFTYKEVFMDQWQYARHYVWFRGCKNEQESFHPSSPGTWSLVDTINWIWGTVVKIFFSYCTNLCWYKYIITGGLLVKMEALVNLPPLTTTAKTTTEKQLPPRIISKSSCMEVQQPRN